MNSSNTREVALWLLLASLGLSALGCGSDASRSDTTASPGSTATGDAASATSRSTTPEPPPTTSIADDPASDPPTSATTTQTAEVATSSSTPPASAARFDFVDGRFVGTGPSTLFADATAVLGVEPVRMSEVDLADRVRPCTGTADPWVVQTGGLTLYFEEFEGSGATLTNWTYDGGPIEGVGELVAPNDVRIGDTRQDLMVAHTELQDFGDQVLVNQPVPLRFGLDGDTITWFGVIDCAEGEEPAGG